MTTVFDISLKMMRHVTDLLHGTATDGSTTTLEDTVNLIQGNAYFELGSLWIRSGTHQGKVFLVTEHTGNTLTFGAVTGAIAEGVRFSVARGVFPWEQIKGAIQQSLDMTYVTGHDATLEGDGTTLEFTLPDGVQDVKEVRLEKPNSNGLDSISNHWDERLGKLVFEFGFAPVSGDIIHVYYKDDHAEITDYDTKISAEINEKWLVAQSAVNLMLWAAGMYDKKPSLMLEERINLTMAMLKGKRPRLGSPDLRVKSGGGGYAEY